jgi:hypothetical protein
LKGKELKRKIALGLALALLFIALPYFFPIDVAYRIFFAILLPLWMVNSILSSVRSARERAKRDKHDRLQFILYLTPSLLLTLVLALTLFFLHILNSQASLTPNLLAGLVGGALFLALIIRAVGDIRQRRRFPKLDDREEDKPEED